VSECRGSWRVNEKKVKYLDKRSSGEDLAKIQILAAEPASAQQRDRCVPPPVSMDT
jgi:hypothetical protein